MSVRQTAAWTGDSVGNSKAVQTWGRQPEPEIFHRKPDPLQDGSATGRARRTQPPPCAPFAPIPPRVGFRLVHHQHEAGRNRAGAGEPRRRAAEGACTRCSAEPGRHRQRSSSSMWLLARQSSGKQVRLVSPWTRSGPNPGTWCRYAGCQAPRTGAAGGATRRVANLGSIRAGAVRRRRRVTSPFFLERSPIGSVVVCD